MQHQIFQTDALILERQFRLPSHVKSPGDLLNGPGRVQWGFVPLQLMP